MAYRPVLRPKPKCYVDDCMFMSTVKGLCPNHYKLLLSHGDPLTKKRRANGEGFIAAGYKGHIKNAAKFFEHIEVAKKMYGGPLPEGSIVHHKDGSRDNNSEDNLVICKDRAEHLVLHLNMKALAACGHEEWRRCIYCKQYDSLDNLMHKGIQRHKFYHQKCRSVHDKLDYGKKKLAALDLGPVYKFKGILPGEEHLGAKLKLCQVHEIRSLAGIKTQKELSLIYGVSESAICHIISRRSWANF